MYQVRLPSPPLRPYIECYWSLRGTATITAALREQIFVDGRADILFNFGAPYHRSRGALPGEAVCASNLDAQRLYPVEIVQTGVLCLVGVRFRPGGLAPFLRPPMHELSGQVLDLHTGLGRDALELEARLGDLGDAFAEQAALLDHYFQERLAPSPAHRFVMWVAGQIAAQDGAVSIGALARASGYSPRTVDRLFSQMMGFAPKSYARMVRLQRVLARLAEQPSLPLSALAHACGYADQAHFAREMRALTGTTPTQLRRRLLAARAAPPPNLVQFVQD